MAINEPPKKGAVYLYRYIMTVGQVWRFIHPEHSSKLSIFMWIVFMPQVIPAIASLFASSAFSQDTPFFIQVEEKIKYLILSGVIAGGQRAPSLREIADASGLNPMTVSKAFQRLQDQGYLAFKRGKGMYVVEGAAEQIRTEGRQHFINEELPGIVMRVNSLGISIDTLVDHLHSFRPSQHIQL